MNELKTIGSFATKTTKNLEDVKAVEPEAGGQSTNSKSGNKEAAVEVKEFDPKVRKGNRRPTIEARLNVKKLKKGTNDEEEDVKSQAAEE